MAQVTDFTADQVKLITSALREIAEFNNRTALQAAWTAKATLAGQQALAAKQRLGGFRQAGLTDKSFPGSFSAIRVATLKSDGSMVLLFDEQIDTGTMDVVLDA